MRVPLNHPFINHPALEVPPFMATRICDYAFTVLIFVFKRIYWKDK